MHTRRVVLTVLLTLSAALLARVAAAQDLKQLQQRGYIEIGTTGTAAPYTGVDANDQLVGYDIDWGNMIGKDLGLAVHWQRLAFSGLLPGLGAGRLDMVISAVRITDERKKVFEFSQPYAYDPDMLLVPADNTTVQTVADIKGRVVVTVAGSLEAGLTRQIGGYKDLILVPAGSDVFLALKAGKAEIGVMGIVEARDYIRAGNKDLRMAGAVTGMSAQGMVMRKDETDLRDAVDRIITQAKADGTYAAIYHKHFFADPPTVP